MSWEAKGCEIYDGDTLIAVFKGPYKEACSRAALVALAPLMLGTLYEHGRRIGQIDLMLPDPVPNVEYPGKADGE